MWITGGDDDMKMFQARRSSAAIAAACVLTGSVLAFTAAPAAATAMVVDTTDDVVATDGFCSLPEAVAAANTNAAVEDCPAGSGAEVDVITLPAGTYQPSSEMVLTDPAGVRFVGAGATSTSIEAAGTHRLIDVEDGSLTISALRLADGDAGTATGGAVRTGDDPVSVLDAVVADNHAGHGGAIDSGGGAIVVERSAFTGNVAMSDALNGNGGAINSFGDVTIEDSTFTDNTAANVAGAVHADGITIDGSTFQGNSAKAGGVAYSSFGFIVMSNSTVHENTTTNINENVGGALQTYGQVGLLHVTITDNVGIGLRQSGSAEDDPTVILQGAIITGNDGGDCDYNVPLVSNGGNIDGDGSCSLDGVGDQSSTDPQLGPLADNGGLTMTRLPQPASPAIDAAPNAGCPGVDQRGAARPQDGDGDGTASCDSGTVEVAGTTPDTEPTPDTTPETPTTPTTGGGAVGPSAAATPTRANPNFTG